MSTPNDIAKFKGKDLPSLWYPPLAFKYVPEALKTPELCLLAVHMNGWALEFVPEALKTSDLCLIAVQLYGNTLEFVPDEFKTPEICQVCVYEYM